jgi:two-component system sensor kinase FixL
MNKTNRHKSNLSNLRVRAEEKLNRSDSELQAKPAAEIEHELDVHRVELEMQNEELIHTQTKLLKSVEEYFELFDFAPIGYFILDIHGIITNINHKGLEMLGVDKRQIIGRALSNFIFTQSNQDDFYRHRQAANTTQKKQHLESQLKTSDGTIRYILIESYPINDDKNNFKHLLTTINDITNIKENELRLETLLEKEKVLHEMKSQFITIASHEFRTPLSTILTSAELMEKYEALKDEEKKERHFQKIKTSVNRIKEILIDFLYMNDEEKEEMKSNAEIFNVFTFTLDLIEETKSFNGIHNIKYQQLGRYDNVYLDKTLFKTCMFNLIINAYKYSPEGETILITTDRTSPNLIKISIQDNGIGILEADQPHIFEKFFRGGNTTNTQGTGLGLSITKKLVTLMNGSISFDSTKNKGTTFYMNFPQILN